MRFSSAEIRSSSNSMRFNALDAQVRSIEDNLSNILNNIAAISKTENTIIIVTKSKDMLCSPRLSQVSYQNYIGCGNIRRILLNFNTSNLIWTKKARWEGELHMADDDLSGKLASLLTEIKEVMESRKERIEELRNEIADIEAQNVELEKTISDLLSGFD